MGGDDEAGESSVIEFMAGALLSTIFWLIVLHYQKHVFTEMEQRYLDYVVGPPRCGAPVCSYKWRDDECGR